MVHDDDARVADLLARLGEDGTRDLFWWWPPGGPPGGNRQVLGVAVGDSEDEVLWTTVLRSLRERGLAGVRLVISDAHSGLKAAIARVFQGAAWQRCKVHLMRNLLATVARGSAEIVPATVRTVFAQPDAASTRAHLRVVADTLRERFPAAAAILDEAEADVTAYADFPRAHHKKIASTNPLERVYKEIPVLRWVHRLGSTLPTVEGRTGV